MFLEWEEEKQAPWLWRGGGGSGRVMREEDFSCVDNI
jgi:hypothetical protein